MEPSFPCLFHPNENGSRLPKAIQIDIIKKMRVQSFVKLFRSCKLVNKFIQDNKRYIKLSSLDIIVNAHGTVFSIIGISHLIIRFNGTRKKSSAFWGEIFEYHGLEYFYVKNIRLVRGYHNSRADESDFFENIVTWCQICNIRCQQLTIVYGEFSSRIIDIFKPQVLSICAIKLDSIPENVNLVSQLRFTYLGRRRHHGKYTADIFTELSSSYKGKLQFICTRYPSPAVVNLLNGCLEKMIYSEIPLQELKCDIQSSQRVNTVKIIAPNLAGHTIFEKVVDLPLIVVAYPARNGGFLLLLKSNKMLCARGVGIWKEAKNLVDDFVENNYDSYRFCKWKSIGKEAQLHDQMRKLFE